jgi:hypothetical protein
LHAVLVESCLNAQAKAEAAGAARQVFERAHEAALRADAESNGAYRAIMKAAKLNPDAYRPEWRGETGELDIIPIAPAEATDGSS